MYRSALLTLLVSLGALFSCASEPQFPDASPIAVDECRREAALMTERDPWSVHPDPTRSGAEGDRVIEDARTAEAEAGRSGLADWPEEVLIYRCLVSRGEPLSAEQASELAEWERRLGEQRNR